jgi:predicted nucleic acid-binding protein
VSSISYGERVVLDNSVWARLVDGRIDRGSAAGRRFAAAVRADEVLVCEPFRLEALYSARDARSFAALAEELDAFERVPPEAALWRRAADAQAQLAADRRVSHRVKFVDLLVAASAEAAGAAVLHYDRDYDLLSRHTDLAFASRWVARRGSLG